LERKAIDAPLTSEEVATFLHIVKQLPDNKVPQFDAQPHGIQTQGHTPRQYAAQLQQHYRGAINIEQQGQQWDMAPELSSRFEELGVDPMAFCSLATRVSCAWSAQAVRQKLPIKRTQRQLNERLHYYLTRIETEPLAHEDILYLIDVMEETIALSEFLRIIESVPETSTNAVIANASELSALLPETNSVARFEQHLESTPKVMRVGHSEPAQ